MQLRFCILLALLSSCRTLEVESQVQPPQDRQPAGVASRVGRGCVWLLRSRLGIEAHEDFGAGKLADFLPTLKLTSEDYIGRQLTFEESVEATYLGLSPEDKVKFIARIRALEKLQIIDSRKPDLGYEVRAVIYPLWKTYDPARRKLYWDKPTAHDRGDLADIQRRTLDFVYTSQTQVPRLWNIWVNGRGRFVDDNVKLLAEKIELLSRGEFVPYNRSMGAGVAWETLQLVRKNMLAALSFNLRVANIKETAVHRWIFENQGPEALYKYLYHSYGSAFAIRYWTQHLYNATALAKIAFLAVMYPTAREMLNYWAQFAFIQLNSKDDEDKVKRLLELNKMRRKTYFDKIRGEISLDDNQAEKKEMLDFTNQIEGELNAQPPKAIK